MPSLTTIQKFFRRAKDASLCSDFSRQKIGAVLVYGGKIIAKGCNSSKTFPMQKTYNKERDYDQNVKNNGAIHAEMMLLQKTRYLDIDWSKASVYIYREHGKTHKPLLAKPCPACQKALIDRGISQVYFSTNEIPYDKL